jgi:hypothetical protein
LIIILKKKQMDPLLPKIFRDWMIDQETNDFFIDNGVSIFLDNSEASIFKVKVSRFIIDEDELEEYDLIVPTVFDQLDTLKSEIKEKLPNVVKIYFAFEDGAFDGNLEKETWIKMSDCFLISKLI